MSEENTNAVDESDSSEAVVHAGLTRRLAAITYDSFLVAAIWLLSTMLVVSLFNDGEPIGGPIFQLFLWFEAFAFYMVFWRLKGQTLGMQVWKIRTESTTGEVLSPVQCLIRFSVATVSLAALGLGFLWVVVSKENNSWHDLASGSRVVYLGSKPYESEQAI